MSEQVIGEQVSIDPIDIFEISDNEISDANKFGADLSSILKYEIRGDSKFIVEISKIQDIFNQNKSVFSNYMCSTSHNDSLDGLDDLYFGISQKITELLLNSKTTDPNELVLISYLKALKVYANNIFVNIRLMKAFSISDVSERTFNDFRKKILLDYSSNFSYLFSGLERVILSLLRTNDELIYLLVAKEVFKHSNNTFTNHLLSFPSTKVHLILAKKSSLTRDEGLTLLKSENIEVIRAFFSVERNVDDETKKLWIDRGLEFNDRIVSSNMINNGYYRSDWKSVGKLILAGKFNKLPKVILGGRKQLTNEEKKSLLIMFVLAVSALYGGYGYYHSRVNVFPRYINGEFISESELIRRFSEGDPTLGSYFSGPNATYLLSNSEAKVFIQNASYNHKVEYARKVYDSDYSIIQYGDLDAVKAFFSKYRGNTTSFGDDPKHGSMDDKIIFWTLWRNDENIVLAMIDGLRTLGDDTDLYIRVANFPSDKVKLKLASFGYYGDSNKIEAGSFVLNTTNPQVYKQFFSVDRSSRNPNRISKGLMMQDEEVLLKVLSRIDSIGNDHFIRILGLPYDSVKLFMIRKFSNNTEPVGTSILAMKNQSLVDAFFDIERSKRYESWLVEGLKYDNPKILNIVMRNIGNFTISDRFVESILSLPNDDIKYDFVIRASELSEIQGNMILGTKNVKLIKAFFDVKRKVRYDSWLLEGLKLNNNSIFNVILNNIGGTNLGFLNSLALLGDDFPKDKISELKLKIAKRKDLDSKIIEYLSTDSDISVVKTLVNNQESFSYKIILNCLKTGDEEIAMKIMDKYGAFNSSNFMTKTDNEKWLTALAQYSSKNVRLRFSKATIIPNKLGDIIVSDPDIDVVRSFFTDRLMLEESWMQSGWKIGDPYLRDLISKYRLSLGKPEIK